jgi:hypothetical protein
MEKFPTGLFVASQQVVVAMRQQTSFITFVYQCVQRHKSGDWGDVGENDRQANEDALQQGNRLFSVYLLPDISASLTGEQKCWVITEAECSVTTVIFSGEY